MILVDTSVWIDYFNGNMTWQTDLLEKYLSTTRSSWEI
jgi:predicted nucleic acid-binding protein